MTTTRISALSTRSKTGRTHADRARDALVLLDLVALLHLRARVLVDDLHAHVLLAAAQLRRVDGDEQALDAARLRVLHVLARDLAVPVHVQLQEERLARRRGVQDVVEGARGERRDLQVSAENGIGGDGRQHSTSASVVTLTGGGEGTYHLDDAGLRCRARESELALGVSELAKSRRGLSGTLSDRTSKGARICADLRCTPGGWTFGRGSWWTSRRSRRRAGCVGGTILCCRNTKRRCRAQIVGL